MTFDMFNMLRLADVAIMLYCVFSLFQEYCYIHNEFRPVLEVVQLDFMLC